MHRVHAAISLLVDCSSSVAHHAIALSASKFVHKKKSQRIYTSMHSGGFKLTKLTYTRLEENLIRHRGDRLSLHRQVLITASIRRAAPHSTGGGNGGILEQNDGLEAVEMTAKEVLSQNDTYIGNTFI